MSEDARNKYADIIDLPHHQSEKRQKMSNYDRAAQFSPFAALTGHADSIKETARLTDEYSEPSEEMKAIMNEKILFLMEQLENQPEITITFFKPDEKKQGGAYITITGVRGQFLTARSELPCMSIFKERIAFNTSCGKKLSEFSHVQLLLHIITVWKKTIPDLGYARHWGIAKNIKFKLPVDVNGNPHFAYMEKYIQNVESAVSSSLTALQLVNGSKNCKKIDVNGWDKFNISNLFDIHKGKRLTKANMIEGNIPFIGASSFNNGITAYIGNNKYLHPKNAITISYNGSVGEVFYQEESFWASDDVNVLYPKIKFNKYIAMFIIPLLKKVGEKYAFIDKWKKEDMKKDYIYLPIKAKGEIDFNFIENYIQNKYLSIRKSLSSMLGV